jgi:hypothetical protein
MLHGPLNVKFDNFILGHKDACFVNRTVLVGWICFRLHETRSKVGQRG